MPSLSPETLARVYEQIAQMADEFDPWSVTDYKGDLLWPRRGEGELTQSMATGVVIGMTEFSKRLRALAAREKAKA